YGIYILDSYFSQFQPPEKNVWPLTNLISTRNKITKQLFGNQQNSFLELFSAFGFHHGRHPLVIHLVTPLQTKEDALLEEFLKLIDSNFAFFSASHNQLR